MQKTTPLKTCDIIKYHKLPNFGYVDEILKINFSKTCGYLPLSPLACISAILQISSSGNKKSRRNAGVIYAFSRENF
jgi:hypothetical protein